jgi:hypothetical protein
MRLLQPWPTVVLCLTLLVTPASAQTTTPPGGGGTGGPDTGSLRSIEGQVEQIRGLLRLSEPDLRVLDHDSLHGYFADQFERDYQPNERERDQKELVALGLIEPTDNLVQIQLHLLSNEIDGVYDPETKSVFVLADQRALGPVQRMTYAYEFDHVLQDQHYDLNKIAPQHPDSADQSLAVHAFIEGDAGLLQMLWAQANLSQDERNLARSTAAGSPDILASVPLVVRTELLFPYNEGFSFVRQLYRQAGNSFAAVDAVFRNPPESTAQVLHSDKYINHVHPVPVKLPNLATQLGPDWREVGKGTLGELDTRALLQQWGTDPSEANRVASGWSGDQWQLVESEGGSAIVVRSTWETPAAATDFFSAYSSGLSNRFELATIEESSTNRQALTTPSSATDVRLEGADVLTVIASDRETADGIVNAVTAP